MAGANASFCVVYGLTTKLLINLKFLVDLATGGL